MSVIAYWDIDGTLLQALPGRRDLFADAVEELGATPRKPSEPREGCTDRRLAEMYLDAAAEPRSRVEEFLSVLDTLSTDFYTAQPREATAGALAALALTASLGWRNALMTGNTPTRARVKLSTAGIDPAVFDSDLSVSGGFVSDRRELGRRARSLTGAAATLIVLGDTRHDLNAALAADALFVAVSIHPDVRDDLASEARIAIENLLDPAFAAFVEGWGD